MSVSEAQVREMVRAVLLRTLGEADRSDAPRSAATITESAIAQVASGQFLTLKPGDRITPLARDAARERNIQLIEKPTEPIALTRSVTNKTIALAADQIVMDPNAVLGPVDPQIGDMPAASIVKLLDFKRPVAISDEMLVMADVSQKARIQVAYFVGNLLLKHMPKDKAGELAVALSENGANRVARDATAVNAASNDGEVENPLQRFPRRPPVRFGDFTFVYGLKQKAKRKQGERKRRFEFLRTDFPSGMGHPSPLPRHGQALYSHYSHISHSGV